ncbi:MAG: YggT family protein [Candidatus Dormibacteraeota bacterium]|nr:YggT family protein [Candidatus Dormibacteraeota bacterium]
MNLAGTAINVINAVAFVLYVLILARILVSWLPVSPWNPIVRWLRRIVDPILRPFRRILPTIGGLDLSPLLAILIIFFVARLATQALSAFAFGGQVNVAADVVLLIAQLIENIIIVLGVLVLIRLLVSIFSADPWHPLVMGIRSMTNPLVRPFAGLARRGMRTGFDMPALATLITYVVLYVVVQIVFATLLVNVL